MMDGNGTDHAEQEMVGAYVLDALTPEEAAAFEAHLRTCARCRVEVAELGEVVDVLPLAVEPVLPPAALKARLMQAVDGERQGATQTVSRPRRNALAPWVLAVAAAVVIAGLGIWNIELQQEIHRSTPVDRVAALIASGARVTNVSGTSAAPGASAALVQPQHHKPAYLVVHGLPPNAPSRVYQVWLVRGDTPRSAGIFRYHHGTGVVALPGATAGYAAVAVTQEPAPHGSPQPTGRKLLVGTLPA
jgi:anti-sigma-K factor RskA